MLNSSPSEDCKVFKLYGVYLIVLTIFVGISGSRYLDRREVQCLDYSAQCGSCIDYLDPTSNAVYYGDLETSNPKRVPGKCWVDKMKNITTINPEIVFIVLSSITGVLYVVMMISIHYMKPTIDDFIFMCVITCISILGILLAVFIYTGFTNEWISGTCHKYIQCGKRCEGNICFEEDPYDTCVSMEVLGKTTVRNIVATTWLPTLLERECFSNNGSGGSVMFYNPLTLLISIICASVIVGIKSLIVTIIVWKKLNAETAAIPKVSAVVPTVSL